MDIAVVIPAFNEAGSIFEVASAVAERGYDAIVVDDGSTDATFAEASSAGSKVLRHRTNRGYGAALTTGSEWAVLGGYDVIVHFDADGQHDPDEIAAIVEPIANGTADVTMGSRFLGRGEDIPALRKVLLKVAVVFTRAVSGVKLSDAHNGLRGFSRAAMRKLDCREDGMAYASEVVDRIGKLGLRYREVPVTVSYSAYSMGKGEGNVAKMRLGLRVLWTKLTH